MAVTVHLPAVLRADAGDRVVLEVSAHGDLQAVMDEVDRNWPRLGRRLRDEQGALRRFVNVYVDSADCRSGGGLAMAVSEGSEVLILPSVAGG